MQTDRRQIMSFIDDVKKELAPQKPLPVAPDMNACSAAAQQFVNMVKDMLMESARSGEIWTFTVGYTGFKKVRGLSYGCYIGVDSGHGLCYAQPVQIVKDDFMVDHATCVYCISKAVSLHFWNEVLSRCAAEGIHAEKHNCGKYDYKWLYFWIEV